MLKMDGTIALSMINRPSDVNKHYRPSLCSLAAAVADRHHLLSFFVVLVVSLATGWLAN